MGELLDSRIFWDLRVPRVAAALLAGIALSVSGLSLQTVFQNPLAGPFVLGISSGASFAVALSMLAVWILLALWHRLSWNLLLWGAYSGLLLLLEQTVLEYRLKKLPRWFRRVLTLFLIFLGWVFFFTPDPGTAFLYLHRMVGLFTVPFADRAAAYYLRSSWLVLAIALVGILPITKDLCDRVLCSRQLWLRLLAGLVFGALLYLSAAALLGGAETAFLYFQF